MEKSEPPCHINIKPGDHRPHKECGNNGSKPHQGGKLRWGASRQEEQQHTCCHANQICADGQVLKLPQLPLVGHYHCHRVVSRYAHVCGHINGGTEAQHAEAKKEYRRLGGNLWDACLETLEKREKPVILRLPIIPGINDHDDHLRSAAGLAKRHSCIQKVQVMPYHAIGADKWHQLGYEYSLEKLPSATPEQKAHWQRRLDSFL